jgi:general secretion pathway protein F
MLDGFALRLPVVGGLVERRETGRLARTLSTLVHNGVPIVEAVRISESVLTNRRFRRAVREAGTAIAEGSTLAAPLQRSGLFSALFLRLTAVGEETGQLDVMLRRAASIYETALIRQIERVTALVTPVTTVVIGAVVGGLILTVMSAIVSINDLALQ